MRLLTGQRVTIAFGKNVISSQQWLRPNSECGSCCPHIRIVTDYETNMRVVELSMIEHKYVIIQSGHSITSRNNVLSIAKSYRQRLSERRLFKFG